MLEGLAPSSHTGLTTGLIHHFTLGKFDSILIELKNRLSNDEEVVINLESEPLNSITTHSMAVQPVLQESDISVHELDHEDKSPSSLLSAKKDVEASVGWRIGKAGAKPTGIVHTATDGSSRQTCRGVAGIETVGEANACVRNAVNRDRALRVGRASSGQQGQSSAESCGLFVMIHEFVFQIVVLGRFSVGSLAFKR